MPCSLAGDLHCGLHYSGPNRAPSTVAAHQQRLRTLREFDLRPLLVIWETTQACHLIDQIAEMRVPLFVLTGGDPIKRPDLVPIIEYACRRGLRTSRTPSATPLLARNVAFQFKNSGLMLLALSLDGSTAELHDGFRGVAGSYRQTPAAVEWCHQAGLPVQVNTTISRYNLADLDNMVELLSSLKVLLWSVFFLVPTGRAQFGQMLGPEEHERAFAQLYAASKK